jgi:uncharacterized protein (TIGR03435 family)
MRAYRAIATTFLGLLSCAALAQDLKVGDPAPDFTVRRLEGDKAGREVKLSELKGKVVVLEFWATWCTPCRQAMPHLAKVSKELAGKSVEVLAVTNEQPAKVAAFLEKNPIGVPVAIDGRQAAGSAYGVSTIPHTVIIGPTGRIAAITSPMNVSRLAIESVLAGHDPKLPPKIDIDPSIETDRPGVPAPVVAMVVRESNATRGMSRSDKNRIVADGVSPIALYTLAYELSYYRTVYNVPKEELEKPFFLDVKVPPGKEADLLPQMRRALDLAFGYKIAVEKREQTVSVLKVMPGGESKLKEGAPGTQPVSSFRGDGLEAKNTPIARLADYLEALVGRGVLDETGLKGTYDWKLELVPGNRASLDKALATVGLQLVDEKRMVDVTVVSK